MIYLLYAQERLLAVLDEDKIPLSLVLSVLDS
jgi:hypothetical protein